MFGWILIIVVFEYRLARTFHKSYSPSFSVCTGNPTVGRMNTSFGIFKFQNQKQGALQGHALLNLVESSPFHNKDILGPSP